MEHDPSLSYCRCDTCRARRATYAKEWRRKNPDKGKVKRACADCGREFMAWPDTHRPGKVNRFCSRKCAGIAAGSGARPAILDRSHPLAVLDGRVAVHRKVLFEKLGPGTHPCHWCSRPVTWVRRARLDSARASDLMADHLDGNCRNNDPVNLVPACTFCNVLRGWIQKWERLTGRPIDEMRPIASET